MYFIRDIPIPVAQENPALAHRFLNYEWLANGENFRYEPFPLVGTEWSAGSRLLHFLRNLVLGLDDSMQSFKQPADAVARRVLNFPWLADELGHLEEPAIVDINSLRGTLTDYEMLSLLDSGLVGASLDPFTVGALSAVRELARYGAIDRLLEYSWFRDGLTHEELLLLIGSAFGSAEHYRS